MPADDIADLLKRGREAREAGRRDEAIALFEAAGAADPASFIPPQEVGLTLLQAGERARSAEALRRAVALEPRAWRAFGWLGVALRNIAPLEALEAYDRSLALKPDEPSTQNNRGNVLLDLGRYEEAEAAFTAALALQPGYDVGHVNRGRALFQQGRYADALAAFDTAIALNPQAAGSHFERGAALMGLERWAEAKASYEQAIALNPNHAMAHLGRARAIVELDFLEPVSAGTNLEALASFDRAIALDPGFSEIRWSRALTSLRLGRYHEGWDDYEHRWKAQSFISRSSSFVTADLRARLTPNLTRESLAGRRVVLVAEQGVGDIMMFAAMIPQVMATAASTALICASRFHRLFRASFPGLEFIGLGAPLGPDDVVVAIGSLASLYWRDAADIPGTPYLTASPEALADWAGRLGPRTAPLRVGVSWRGGLDYTAGAARSLTLERMAPVLDLPGCEFVNLQYGDVDAELAAFNQGRANPVRPMPGDTSDFEDLAALVQNLDVVVSVQTAVVHLSGATGTPCLAMIPRKPEWRYGVAGEDLPWYRSVRLFRQGVEGDWAPVLAKVADEVRRRAEEAAAA
ncbi:tetratricopeptide repeat protein [Phenylobacterium sp. J367]|uniref:tetratricopeptide repeat protein n=1 Tax=Phenylobacterium sp. J367 TaxID=2898435 RepID=UPI0021510B6B|nr:tetratricopeptide repeat protein [Phenylobacterium sp. J367]MCR5878290.1 tetratricopeptide repeat protein [Phenylobacterium sp. J367]